MEIRQAQTIPYYDHGDTLAETIKNSSARRKMSPIQFAIRKIRNICLFRMAYHCPLNNLRIKMHRKRGITIGKHVFIGLHCDIDNAYPEFIYIGDNASLAGGNMVIAHANPMEHFKNVIEAGVAPIVVKEGAWVGAGAILLRGVTIGKNAIVSAGTVVDKDVPDYSMAKGNPMKIVAEYSALMDN